VFSQVIYFRYHYDIVLRIVKLPPHTGSHTSMQAPPR